MDSSSSSTLASRSFRIALGQNPTEAQFQSIPRILVNDGAQDEGHRQRAGDQRGVQGVLRGGIVMIHVHLLRCSTRTATVSTLRPNCATCDEMMREADLECCCSNSVSVCVRNVFERTECTCSKWIQIELQTHDHKVRKHTSLAGHDQLSPENSDSGSEDSVADTAAMPSMALLAALRGGRLRAMLSASGTVDIARGPAESESEGS